MQQLRVPDIGDFRDLPVVEILIKAGDVIAVEQPLIVIESDKAVMDVPSTLPCTIRQVLVKPGDKVSRGSVIAEIDLAEHAANSVSEDELPVRGIDAGSPREDSIPAPVITHPEAPRSRQLALAGPAARRLARKLSVELDQVPATGHNGRVLRDDILAFVKAQREQPAAATGGEGLGLLPWPQVDFSQFGPIERRSLARIKRLSGANLHRNWVRIPHVTNHSQADVTGLENLRQALNQEARDGQAKITLLAFMIKACVAALQRFPQFNVSLEGDDVVQKHYFHIGFAADTPHGLVVPVIRDADRKGITALAEEMASLSRLARAGKLAPAQMQGGCFSISSLGGIGGGHFTPIINAPEVAILGVGRADLQPRWDGNAFQPRLQLPLSLSWDHRAVDGAEAGRFLAHLVTLLGDFRRVMM